MKNLFVENNRINTTKNTENLSDTKDINSKYAQKHTMYKNSVNEDVIKYDKYKTTVNDNPTEEEDEYNILIKKTSEMNEQSIRSLEDRKDEHYIIDMERYSQASHQGDHDERDKLEEEEVEDIIGLYNDSNNLRDDEEIVCEQYERDSVDDNNNVITIVSDNEKKNKIISNIENDTTSNNMKNEPPSIINSLNNTIENKVNEDLYNKKNSIEGNKTTNTPELYKKTYQYNTIVNEANIYSPLLTKHKSKKSSQGKQKEVTTVWRRMSLLDSKKNIINSDKKDIKQLEYDILKKQELNTIKKKYILGIEYDKCKKNCYFISICIQFIIFISIARILAIFDGIILLLIYIILYNNLVSSNELNIKEGYTVWNYQIHDQKNYKLNNGFIDIIILGFIRTFQLFYIYAYRNRLKKNYMYVSVQIVILSVLYSGIKIIFTDKELTKYLSIFAQIYSLVEWVLYMISRRRHINGLNISKLKDTAQVDGTDTAASKKKKNNNNNPLIYNNFMYNNDSGIFNQFQELKYQKITQFAPPGNMTNRDVATTIITTYNNDNSISTSSKQKRIDAPGFYELFDDDDDYYDDDDFYEGVDDDEHGDGYVNNEYEEDNDSNCKRIYMERKRKVCKKVQKLKKELIRSNSENDGLVVDQMIYNNELKPILSLTSPSSSLKLIRNYEALDCANLTKDINNKKDIINDTKILPKDMMLVLPKEDILNMTSKQYLQYTNKYSIKNYINKDVQLYKHKNGCKTINDKIKSFKNTNKMKQIIPQNIILGDGIETSKEILKNDTINGEQNMIKKPIKRIKKCERKQKLYEYILPIEYPTKNVDKQIPVSIDKVILEKPELKNFIDDHSRFVRYDNIQCHYRLYLSRSYDNWLQQQKQDIMQPSIYKLNKKKRLPSLNILVLYHGFGGNSLSYQYQIPHLLRSTSVILCFDRPGSGLTERLSRSQLDERLNTATSNTTTSSDDNIITTDILEQIKSLIQINNNIVNPTKELQYKKSNELFSILVKIIDKLLPERNPYSIDFSVKLTFKLLEHLCLPIQECGIMFVGHHSGAMVALKSVYIANKAKNILLNSINLNYNNNYYLLKNYELQQKSYIKGIIFLGPSIFDDTIPNIIRKILYSRIGYIFIETLLHSEVIDIALRHFWYNKNKIPINIQQQLKSISILPNWTEGFLCLTRLKKDNDYTMMLESIDIPILLLCGTYDKIVSIESIIKIINLLKNVEILQISRIDNCGNSIHEERPKLCARTIRLFFKNLFKSSRKI